MEISASKSHSERSGYEGANASFLAGYRKLRRLGHGSQGKVYLAERESDGQKVAIKRLAIESVKNWKAYDLFHREADVLQSLNIQGVARFYDAVDCLDQDPPCSYIVQEYIPGKSLLDLFLVGHRLSIDVVYDIILQLLHILKQLHEHHPPVIHRDIKPSNILLVPTESDLYRVYLIDFGAVANPQVQGGGSTVAGTYGYMPPEQLMGKPVPASDVYALAAVAVYMISGRDPASMPVRDYHLIFEPDMQNMPVVVVNTIRRMLEPDLEKRLYDLEQLIDIFEHFSRHAYDIGAVTELSEITYDAKLNKVETFGQSGNVELWQRLPDKTPREIPQPYRKIQVHSNWRDHQQIFEYFDKSWHVIKGSMGLANAVGLSMLIGSVSVLTFIFLQSNLDDALEHSGESGVSTLNIASVCIVVLGLVLIFFIMRPHIRKMIVSHRLQKNFEKTEIFHHPKLDKLIQTGRKTIATVVSNEYINTDDSYLELGLEIRQRKEEYEESPNEYGYVENNGYEYVENTGCSVINHSIPSFRLVYKFNPPDDENERDLYHNIIVHSEVDVKPGDPLPILYRIYRANGIEYVDSMPFPLPLHELVDARDIFYQNH